MFNENTVKSGGSFTIHPQGTFSAVCVCVIDLGTQLIKSPQFGDKQQRTVRIAFETSELIQEPGEYHGKPYLAQQQFNVSSHEKASLRIFMESWRGRKYASEAQAVEGLSRMDKMIGFPALLNIQHSDCGKYANIASVSPLMRGTEPLQPVMETVIFSLDMPVWQEFAKLTDRTKEKIMLSPEYQKIAHTIPEQFRPQQQDAQQQTQQQTQQHSPQQQQQFVNDANQAAAAAGAPAIDFDDEIPF